MMYAKSIKKILFFLLCMQISLVLICDQPITIFCHGIVDNHNQMNRYQAFIQEPKKSFDFPDAQKPTQWNINSLIFNTMLLFGKHVNRDKMYMGYGEDVKTLEQQINPDESYILFGFSRGGSTIINYLAHNDADNIKAVVLNATPADIVATINIPKYFPGYTVARNRALQEYIFNVAFPHYKIGSVPAFAAISHIKNKHIPIFIIHSTTDTVVHISSAWKLYNAFLQAGFTDVYICELKSGTHKDYPNSPDKIKILQNLHSFYKKYQFNYNSQYAIFDDLTNMQPKIYIQPEIS